MKRSQEVSGREDQRKEEDQNRKKCTNPSKALSQEFGNLRKEHKWKSLIKDYCKNIKK